MADTEAREAKHKGLIPYKPGQSGNPAGRPKGSRNKLGEAFVQALHDDFLEHGVATIEAVREKRPHEYLKVVASLLPRELKVNFNDELSDDELDKRIRQLAGIIGVEVGTAGPVGAQEKTERPKPPRNVSTLQ